MNTMDLIMKAQLWTERENTPSLSPRNKKSKWSLILPGLCLSELGMSPPAFYGKELVNFWHTLGTDPKSSCGY